MQYKGNRAYIPNGPLITVKFLIAPGTVTLFFCRFTGKYGWFTELLFPESFYPRKFDQELNILL
jgi:hypothetical protein